MRRPGGDSCRINVAWFSCECRGIVKVVEAGFVQSDVAFWAHRGIGIFEGKAPMKGLRVIASLYPEKHTCRGAPKIGN